MNNDRFGRTPDEVEDEARYAYAKGTVLLRAVADRLSAITLKGNPIDRHDLRRLHDQLFEVYELLGSETVFGMGDEPATDAEQAALYAYRDTYSDGTLVTTVIGPPHSSAWSAPLDRHRSGVPWLPKMTGTFGYLPNGPRPPGCEVLLASPPATRKPVAQAAYQDGDASQ